MSPAASSYIADVDDLCVENVADLVAHRVVDRLQLELAGQRVLDAVDQCQLGIPLPRLVHEPRVLERDAQAACERRQQALVCVVVRVLAVEVLEGDHAGRPVPGDERDEEQGLRLFAGDDIAAAPLCLGGEVLVDHQRLARVEHVPGEAAGQDLRLGRQPLAALEQVRVAHEPGRLVEHRDRGALRVEDLLDLVADDVVDRLHLELARERSLDAVDQRQLRVPLPRLVHQARVLERHAQAARERRQAGAGRTRRTRARGRCSCERR